MVREWSDEQKAIFAGIVDLRERQSGCIGIEAGPGSGKSTTIVEGARLILPTHRAVFLAFNKHIAEELKPKLPGNATAQTINSYGWGAVRAAYRGAEIQSNKTKWLVRDVIADEGKRRAWEGAIIRLVSLKKATFGDGTNPPKAVDLLKLHDIELDFSGAAEEEQFWQACADVWKRSINQTSIVDFDDQWFFPVLKKLPVTPYDWALIDEAQDASPTQAVLFKRIAPRIVYVGDPNQSIYGFRGADPDSMQKLAEGLKATVFPLKTCYRCPKLVVERANQVIAPDSIRPAPNAIDGEVDSIDIKDLRREAAPGSWVLCRTTAPLVSECLKFIVEGKRAVVKGRDVSETLEKLIDKVGGSDVGDFVERLQEYARHERVRLEKAEREAQLQALDDKVECLMALSDGARTVDDVRARLRTVFTDSPDCASVTFATAHKAKGLEADDVYVLCPELMPHPKAKSEWARKQEKNLKFVAYTRAMKRLRIVVGGRVKK